MVRRRELQQLLQKHAITWYTLDRQDQEAVDGVPATRLRRAGCSDELGKSRPVNLEVLEELRRLQLAIEGLRVELEEGREPEEDTPDARRCVPPLNSSLKLLEHHAIKREELLHGSEEELVLARTEQLVRRGWRGSAERTQNEIGQFCDPSLRTAVAVARSERHDKCLNEGVEASAVSSLRRDEFIGDALAHRHASGNVGARGRSDASRTGTRTCEREFTQSGRVVEKKRYVLTDQGV